MTRVILLLIDPQIDFHEGGSLAVPGATADSLRIAKMIRDNKSKIDEIFVTMDSHHENHIAHAAFWKDANGGYPEDYLQISHEDVVRKVWLPRDPALYEHCLHYTQRLEANSSSKFKLTIWPPHCLIGSEGHSIFQPIQDALMEWVDCKRKTIEYILKGIADL